MKAIEVDEQTHGKLTFAARVMGCTPSEVVRRLVESWSTAEDAAQGQGEDPVGVRVHAVYRGQRSGGLFNPATRMLSVTDGPGAGTAYASPSAAAMAVVKAINPDRHPNTNGWSFWRVTQSGNELKTLRGTPGAA